jgi:hypothetical protein
MQIKGKYQNSSLLPPLLLRAWIAFERHLRRRCRLRSRLCSRPNHDFDQIWGFLQLPVAQLALDVQVGCS